MTFSTPTGVMARWGVGLAGGALALSLSLVSGTVAATAYAGASAPAAQPQAAQSQTGAPSHSTKYGPIQANRGPWGTGGKKVCGSVGAGLAWQFSWPPTAAVSRSATQSYVGLLPGQSAECLPVT